MLQQYLYLAVDLGPLAVHAGPHPGSDVIRVSLPYVPRGDEAASGSHTWMCGAMQSVENLSTEVLWYQEWEHACNRRSRSPTLCRTMRIFAQLLAGEETLYLTAEDLAEGHVP